MQLLISSSGFQAAAWAVRHIGSHIFYAFIHTLLRLLAPAEETQSDYDDYSIQEESGPETMEEVTVESYSSPSPTTALTQRDHGFRVTPPEETPSTPTGKGARASGVAASRGLNVAVTHSERGNRHSKMIGLPTSPRPTTISPSQSGDVHSTPSTPMRPNDWLWSWMPCNTYHLY